MFVYAFQKITFKYYFTCLFIFRQKKLEKVMEEEGLKDEEVIKIRIVFPWNSAWEAVSCSARC